MITTEPFIHEDEGQTLRLETLIGIRWLAIIGQTIAVLFVAFYLEFEFYLSLCLTVIACSVWLNIFLRLRYRLNYRIDKNATLSLLSFDVLQLAVLLYLTGGLTNPFSILLTVPVVISASTMTFRQTMVLAALVVCSIAFLIDQHLPLPWYKGEEVPIPKILVIGTAIAIIASLAFTSIYAHRISLESRQLSDALAATELILQREQYLSSLDGLAAAAAHELGTPLATIALVAKEMKRELPKDSELQDDAQLLRDQAARCREILQKLTSLSDEAEEHIGSQSIPALLDEIAEPHRNFGVEIQITVENRSTSTTTKPKFVRSPATNYGLGNLLENAVDFAKSKVNIFAWYDDKWVSVSIIDDGPGYPKDIHARIGEPYVTTRKGEHKNSGGGMGLGLFIAKTLLERNGASLEFSHGKNPGLTGAKVTINWPRELLDRKYTAFLDRQELAN